MIVILFTDHLHEKIFFPNLILVIHFLKISIRSVVHRVILVIFVGRPNRTIFIGWLANFTVSLAHTWPLSFHLHGWKHTVCMWDEDARDASTTSEDSSVDMDPYPSALVRLCMHTVHHIAYILYRIFERYW